MDTAVHWDFFGNSSFLDLPIREWRFWPMVLWAKDERGLQFLWLYFHWSKTYRYVQRPEWITDQIQRKINEVTNMQIDNLRMSQRGPPGGYE